MKIDVNFLFTIRDCEKTNAIAVFRKTIWVSGPPAPEGDQWLASFSYMSSALDFMYSKAQEARNYHPSSVIRIKILNEDEMDFQGKR